MSLIIDNFSKEWIPVLEKDRELQLPGNLIPFSDAYLTGMPVRKRLGVNKITPPSTLNGFISEGINDVCGQQPSAEDMTELHKAATEHIRAMTRARASADADYNCEHHTAVMHFLEPTRSS